MTLYKYPVSSLTDFMRPVQQILEVLHGSIFFVDLVEVTDVIPEVYHGGIEDRRHPDGVHASVLEML